MQQFGSWLNLISEKKDEVGPPRLFAFLARPPTSAAVGICDNSSLRLFRARKVKISRRGKTPKILVRQSAQNQEPNFVQIIFQKPIDKCPCLWYNQYVR